MIPRTLRRKLFGIEHMIRNLCKVTTICLLLVYSARSHGQCTCEAPSCEAPSCVAPSCVAPSCVAPSCVAPCDMHYGCAETTHCCGVPCQCCGSNNGSGSCQCCGSNHGSGSWLSCFSNKCRKPFINIDCSRTINKTVTKKNVGWAGFGEAPPQGFAVSSMPVLPVNISAMPISFNSAAAASSADSDELARLLRELLREKNSAAAATAANTPAKCDDPCGQILQLRNDVDQLATITRNLTAAVEELAKREKARE